MPIVLTRATKQEARYKALGGVEHCSACRFYMPQGTCGRIIGPVSPEGWCKYYSREMVQRWQPGSAGGNAAALPPGATLDLSFMSPGALDPRITFTRASTATYTDGTGTIQTAATNAPRWDYDPVTHQLRGLLIEEARTNIAFPSGNLAAAPWAPVGVGGGTVPTVVANAAMAPDGTTTATRINYPATAAGVSSVNNNLTMTAAGYACSIHARGVVGGETIWLSITQNATLYYRVRMQLTTQWQRFSFATGTLTAQVWALILGVDLRDGTSQTPQPAQGVYVWGAQVELGDHATSLIPTTSAAVTRAADLATISPANMVPWFNSSVGSWFAEFVDNTPISLTSPRVIGPNSAGVTPLWVSTGANLSSFDGVVIAANSPLVTVGAISKGVSTWGSGNGKVCLNGGPIVAGAQGTGFASLASTGISVLMGNPGVLNESMTGTIRRVSYWPRVLSGAEMQQVTT